MYTLIDATGFIIRALATAEDHSPVWDGQANKPITSALAGHRNFVTRYLTKWAENCPHKLILVWEGGNDFRTSFFPEYKAKRKPATTEQRAQRDECIALVRHTAESLGMLSVHQEQREADDVIAYLCGALDGEKLVHTVDNDLTVLSADTEVCVTYHKPKTKLTQAEDIFYTAETFQQEHQFPPELLTLKKSIVGDTSDGYKGVSGLGVKAWEKLLTEYGVQGLQEINQTVLDKDWVKLAKDSDEMECSILTSMAANHKELLLSYQLATLYPTTCNTVVSGKGCYLQWSKAVPIKGYVDNNLKFLNKLEQEYRTLVELEPSFHLVTKENLEQSLVKMFALIERTPIIGWDYETYDPNRYENLQSAYSGNGDFVDSISSVPCGVSFSVGATSSTVFYFSQQHKDTDNLPTGVVREVLQRVFDCGVEMVAHNISFEAVVSINKYDLTPKSWTDTLLFSRNLFENSNQHGLKYLSKKYLGSNQDTYKETLEMFDANNMSDISGSNVLKYACDDSLVTSNLMFLFRPMAQVEGINDFVTKYDCPSQEILAKGFLKGVVVDQDRLEQLQQEDQNQVKESMQKIRQVLQDNCSKVNLDAASNLHTQLKPYQEKLLQQKGKSPHEITEKLQGIYNKYIVGSQYIPYEEKPTDVNFKPTIKSINNVVALLVSDTQLPEITSVSAKSITDYIVSIDQEGISEDQKIFLQLLAPCAGKVIKERSGEDYINFKSFCERKLQHTLSTVKHGTELLLSSPTQTLTLLYCMLDLPIRLTTKVNMGSQRHKMGFREGGPSTDVKAIQTALAEDCTGEDAWKEVVLTNLVLVKQCMTRQSIYWNKYPLWVHPVDGRVHPQINQSATTTHRPTGGSPNLLQVAKKDGGRTRSMINVGRTDLKEPMVFVSIDFNGQELRLLASACEDKDMLDAYLGEYNKDLHSMTACEIAATYLQKVAPHLDTSLFTWENKEVLSYPFLVDVIKNADNYDPVVVKTVKSIRAVAKTVNFGVVFGISSVALARELIISSDVAEKFMDKMFSRFPRIEKWKQELWRKARVDGYVQTPFGSRRHCFPDIVSKSYSVKGRSQRQVANFMMQGTAADILKVVLTKSVPLYEATGSFLVAPVYDELASGVPLSEVFKFVTQLSEIMRITPQGHQVPMVPEVSIGRNWGQQDELGESPTYDHVVSVLKKYGYDTETVKRA